jgi:uncharacterized membrane protein HdeD (DUF308 family)
MTDLGRSDMAHDPARPGSPIPAAFARSLHDHWVLFLVEGIALIVLGLVAILLPAVASLAFTIFIGWLLLLAGVVGLVMTLIGRGAPGFWWSLASALLAIVAGGVLLWWPFRGEVSLTLVLILFFLVDGIASIMLAVEHRRELSGRWGWLVAGGVVDLALAAIILAGFPGSALWVLGLLIGINLVFNGCALVAVALGARSAAP